MPPGRRLVLGALVASALLLVGCGGDGDDAGARATTTVAAADDPSGATSGICSPGDVEPVEDALAALAHEIEWIPGDPDGADDEPGAATGGHTHVGPLVEPGEPHLHYCLTLANGYDAAAGVTLVQVLPEDSERPLALVEADALGEAAPVDARLEGRGVLVGPGERVTLELLVPAPEAPGELRHRIAYTVEAPEVPRDLFLELDPVPVP